MLPQVILDQRLGTIAMLGRDQELLDLRWSAIDVTHRHLSLTIGTQIGEDLSLANVSEPLGELVRERDW